jgi:hypothetical protein
MVQILSVVAIVKLLFLYVDINLEEKNLVTYSTPGEVSSSLFPP